MGLLKSLFKLLLGLTTGFALGYTAVSWLIGQERRLTGGSGAAGADGGADGATTVAPGFGTALLDQTLARFRLAMDEGRRAAAAAREEREAEIKGRAPAAPAL